MIQVYPSVDRSDPVAVATREPVRRSPGGQHAKIRFSGRLKYQVLCDMAFGGKTHRRISNETGLSETRLSRIARRYAEEIEELRREGQEKVIKEATGLWVRETHLRIAALQEIVEDILRRAKGGGHIPATAYKVAVEGIHEVAVQLGQIPEKVESPAGDITTYTVRGVPHEQVLERLT